MKAHSNRIMVKICGLQDVEVLKSIVHLPIDLIGFVFAKSRRQVTAEQAGEMIRLLRADDRAQGSHVPLTAGVFMNPSQEELELVLREVPLDIVQLHGQETPELCQWVKQTFGVQVMKVISIGSQPADGGLDETLLPYVGRIDILMLDTFEPLVGGGSGHTFAWDRIPAYQEWASAHDLPLLVAGGLNADNVIELLDGYRLDGVDVSSGVETDGVKDVQKITAFVERVKFHASNAG
ncbi:MAG: N-(5-phosphoribosyl)anthranilate isomerase [Paenibacillus sp.]|nr:N-(5-phosphoribosyl)anthranilate isomerase [Paenibacillus sp.]